MADLPRPKLSLHACVYVPNCPSVSAASPALSLFFLVLFLSLISKLKLVLVFVTRLHEP